MYWGTHSCDLCLTDWLWAFAPVSCIQLMNHLFLACILPAVSYLLQFRAKLYLCLHPASTRKHLHEAFFKDREKQLSFSLQCFDQVGKSSLRYTHLGFSDIDSPVTANHSLRYQVLQWALVFSNWKSQFQVRKDDERKRCKSPCAFKLLSFTSMKLK